MDSLAEVSGSSGRDELVGLKSELRLYHGGDSPGGSQTVDRHGLCVVEASLTTGDTEQS